MNILVVYGTSTGKTEDIASRLSAQLGAGIQVRDADELAGAEELCGWELIICCTPTWNTGADSARSGTAWDSLVEEIPHLNLKGTSVAIVGLGDSSSYSDYFCDAMEELHAAFQKSGARMVGMVPTDGYTFNDSKSVINGMFCGLPIDEDSEPDLTDERITAWVAQLRHELGTSGISLAAH